MCFAFVIIQNLKKTFCESIIKKRNNKDKNKMLIDDLKKENKIFLN